MFFALERQLILPRRMSPPGGRCVASFRQQLARRGGFVVALWAPDAAVPCVTETRECGLALTVSAAAAAPRHAARVKMISMVDRMLRAALPPAALRRM